MNKNLQAQLRQHLVTLKLPAVSRLYEETARIAEKNSLSYEEFLAELIGQEILNRSNNMIARNLKDSALPPQKTLEMLDRSLLPKKAQRQLTSILSGDFINRRENLLFFGNPGTGKTHLACAIGGQMIQKGRRVKFYNTGKLVEYLLVQKQSLRFTKA
jgi:DNA replication protein DnaC